MGGGDRRYRDRTRANAINLKSALVRQLTSIRSTYIHHLFYYASVKTTMVTLLGLPHITISVVPLSEHLPNVMNIPFISGFISSAINTAAAEYVAPKSLTLDLQKLISGDDIKKGMLTKAPAALVLTLRKTRMPSAC